jgi:UDP-GlcNAc:undecaprenyl-phosphate/decaprenyl-phosphate GlcNAc-1-phosphate transferase
VILLVICSAAAAIAGTWAARALALRLGFVSHPNPIVPQHTKPVAYLGGAGVAVAVAVAIAIASLSGTKAIVPLFVWMPALLFLALGVTDDLRPFSAAKKVLLQSAVAALAVILGFRADVSDIAIVDAFAAFLWIIALVNAVNVTDVCDGLVAGVSVPLFLALAVLNAARAPLALAVAGACVGFLFFNRPPATIFLGDGGSHLLGFLAATLTHLSRRSFPAALLVTGVFLFELLFLIFVRTRKGLRWWLGSRDHFALRLQAAGLSKVQTDLVAIAAGIVVAAMAVAADAAEPNIKIALLAFATILALVAGRLLLRWEVMPR